MTVMVLTTMLVMVSGAEAKGWLNPTQTLVEQGLLDDSVVTLKKKFYVDDDRVDRSDPVQLHLVYVQCHECTSFVLFPLIGSKMRQSRSSELKTNDSPPLLLLLCHHSCGEGRPPGDPR